MARQTRPLLAITMGDPAGVGPEVVVGALAQRRVREACRALIIGDARTLRMASRGLEERFDPTVVSDAKELRTSKSGVCLLDLQNADPGEIPLGQVSRAAGLAAASYIREAVDLALSQEVSGIVTGPINKEALRLADVPYPGHTEMLAALCGADRVAMMLVHGDMLVSHVTTHVPLRNACDLVKLARVLDVIRLTDQAVRRMGVARPRIAVAGLNPHAGESGLFGDEEEDEIAPAVERARGEGIEVFGPLPPDTVFARQRAGEFDAVVAMTHDQGHIAVKTAGFSAARTNRRINGKTDSAAQETTRTDSKTDVERHRPDSETDRTDSKTDTIWERSAGEKKHFGAINTGGGGLRVGGVNVTLGLPIVRTSVDHGTAFDIVGQGLADPSSMADAILLAARMSRGRG